MALATYLAILKFNDGDISFLKIFSEFHIVPGIFTSTGAQDCDNARIRLSAKKSTEKVKKKRKALRHLRKHYIDNIEDQKVNALYQDKLMTPYCTAYFQYLRHHCYKSRFDYTTRSCPLCFKDPQAK